MIKIEKNDSIIDIIIKIKNCKAKEIVLEFPFGHPVLHNYTSLKILKTKAGKKDLVIVTNDKTAKRIGKKIGIKYNLVTKPDVNESNYTFFEYFVYTIKSYYKEAKYFLLNKARENSFAKYQKIYTNGKIGFFTIFLLLSISLLVFIFYFAVNKTYIHITPEIETRVKGKNFFFEKMGDDELVLNDDLIKLKEIQKISNISTKILTSGIDESEQSRATGKVLLKNLTIEDTYLVKNSRLVTTDGLVFLLEHDVTIPGAITNEAGEVIPGELEAKVIARIDDINGNIIGKNGNIGAGITLTFPGLKEDADKIYAVSSTEFSGGKTVEKRILAEKDIENAINILKTKLEETGLNEIKKELEAENKAKNVKYEIFGVSGAIKYTDFTYSGIENLKIGDPIKEFEIFGTIKTTVYAYNKEIVLNKLKNYINDRLLANVESIFSIDEDSLKISGEISKEENPFRVKATVQINVNYIQNFLSEKNNYVEKLKYQIAGLTEDEAEKILINTGKISSVDIKITPFFVNKITKIVDNIRFEIKK